MSENFLNVLSNDVKKHGTVIMFCLRVCMWNKQQSKRKVPVPLSFYHIHWTSTEIATDIQGKL